VSRPQVIDDEEHERVHERVAAADVAKDSGMACTRTPHPARPGPVWTVKARMGAIRTLGRQLASDGIEVVTLESTSDSWRIWFFVLEACGLAVQLVNAAQARNLPGRPKTDLLTNWTRCGWPGSPGPVRPCRSWPRRRPRVRPAPSPCRRQSRPGRSGRPKPAPSPRSTSC
jgi:hypothetical protein